jgi:hypothetical protein
MNNYFTAIVGKIDKCMLETYARLPQQCGVVEFSVDEVYIEQHLHKAGYPWNSKFRN